MEGTPFGRYRLIELLGRGGMGEVWRAHDTNTDRIVAVKVLPARLATDPTFEQRFRREAHAAARLHHPHIVPIHDYGEIDGRLYVDMALIDGHDLTAEIAGGPLPPERAVAIIEQIARALQAAHKAGLVHRDVKPSNILIDDEDNAYLIDFGIARAATDSALTGTGNTLGTFNYMAPERFTTDHIDHRSDIYALTCVLYEALTGTRTFPGDTLERQFAGHLNTPPPKPSAVGLSPAFDTVIATGLAKDPAQRHQNAKDLAVAARNALEAPVPAKLPVLPDAPVQSHTGPDTGIGDAPTTTISEPPVSAWQGPPTEIVARSPRTAEPVPIPANFPAAELGSASLHHPDAAGQHRSSSARRRKTLFLAAAAIAVIIGVIAAITIVTNNRDDSSSTAQVVLPFTGLHRPSGIAVDSTGAVYVADPDNNRVLKLATGADSPTELPLNGLRKPSRVAVDSRDNVYVLAQGEHPIVKFDPATNTQSPVAGNFGAELQDLTVSASGDVYVATYRPTRIAKLTAGADVVSDLDIDLSWIALWRGIAVDPAGNIYLLAIPQDSSGRRLLRYAAGTNAASEFPVTESAESITADSAGNIYVGSSMLHEVAKIDAGSHTQTFPSFAGSVMEMSGIAVDTERNLYANDSHNNQVLKLKLPAR
ncbi:MAG: serine/threonine-protein kinase [Gordonia amarae]